MSIDSKWQEFIDNLNTMGLSEYMETMQKAFDRQYK